jgi:glycine hydroxymethyltransferase
VPYDKQSPFVTSGIRIGTPCVTVRGMKEAEMNDIAGWIGEVVAKPADAAVKAKVKKEVEALCGRFKVY